MIDGTDALRWCCVALPLGLHWYPLVGRTVKVIPTAVQNLDIKKSTVVDRNGNPIVVGGVVTFQIVDSIKAAFGVCH